MEKSIRKLKANARNAQLSTGPKDTSRTRLNAAKHGILSKDVLIRAGDGKESQEEFDEFRGRMWEDLAPAGALEESLVEELICNIWRKRRVVAHESALISKKAATARRDWEERNRVSVDLEGMLSPYRKPEPEIPDLETLWSQLDSAGEGSKFDQLLGATASILSEGNDGEASSTSRVSPFLVAVHRVRQAEKAVAGAMGGESDLSNPALQNAVIELVQGWGIYTWGVLGPNLGRSFSAEEIEMLIAAACEQEGINREEFWSELDYLVEDRLAAACYALKELELESQREIQLASLPDEAELAKIQRYEAHFSSLHDKTLHELQRLQVARLSSRPSAPMAVDVNLAA